MSRVASYPPSLPTTAAASPEPAGGLWHVPLPRNAYFTGRERVLDGVRSAFVASPAGRTQIVYGLGGVGKTQLAAEYAHRHRGDYRLVWWLRAEDPATLAIDFARLAEHPGLDADLATLAAAGSATGASADAARRALLTHLAGRTDWLLIFDGADGPDVVRPFLPASGGGGGSSQGGGGGHVLVTSRNPNWDGVGHAFCLRVWERAEAVSFLNRRLNKRSVEPAAVTLAQALGDHPLALDQAASTIARRRISFADYLRQFEDHWAELLRSGRTLGEYPDTVAMTWELAFREVEEDASEAVTLLKVCSFFAAAGIPRSFLSAAAAYAPEPLNRLQDRFELDRAIEVLLRYSLVEADEHEVRIHRLVAAMTRDRMEPEWLANWCGHAVRAMAPAFPFDEADPRSWPRAAALLPHALAAAGYAEALDAAPGATGKLLNRVGEYLFATGQYPAARDALERALVATTHAHGQHNPRRSAVANNLAKVLRRIGEADRARAHLQEAMAVDAAAYGDDHRHVAQLANNLGACLHESGDFAAAREHFAWALDVCLAHHGPEHRDVASVTNNLGYALASMGDLAEAVPRFRQALGTAEATYGPGHPVTAHIQTNLGLVLLMQGQSVEAGRELSRAIVAAEAALGPDHPDVARVVTCLGLLELDRGQPARARPHLERAIAIDDLAYARPSTTQANRLAYLARCLKAIGDVDRAVACHERSTAILWEIRAQQAARAEVPPTAAGTDSAADPGDLTSPANPADAAAAASDPTDADPLFLLAQQQARSLR